MIDRSNSNWAIVDSTMIPLLKLLSFPAEVLPDEVRTQRSRLQAELLDAGVGGAPYVAPGDFNTLILKLTKVCNYRCKYCYDMEPDDALVHMPYKVAEAALKEAIRLAPAKQKIKVNRPDLTVILHGGEPSLFFSELIKPLVIYGEQEAGRQGKTLFFCGQTNLSRLTQEMVAFYEEHQIGWGVSLDGPPALNDHFRVLANGDGTYQLYEKALERFPDFVRSCGILTTVSSANQGHLLSIARHFRDVGVPSWQWSLFQAIGLGRGCEGTFGVSADEVIRSWNELLTAVEEGEFDGFGVMPIVDYIDNLIIGAGNNMCMRKGCGAARDLLSVSADGTIEACDCLDRKGPLAGLGLIQIETEDSLHRARESGTAAKIRSRDVTRGQCHTCMWLTACGGTCLAYAEDLHGRSHLQCAVAMNAFTRITESLVRSSALRRYWQSFRKIDWDLHSSPCGNKGSVAPGASLTRRETAVGAYE
ncbi:MAG TPA: radical SAM protein [Candidatus Angelobacter sp.]|nr:radical SAM protein [Candidatus Angelobacter sp.]